MTLSEGGDGVHCNEVAFGCVELHVLLEGCGLEVVDGSLQYLFRFGHEDRVIGIC